MARADGNIKDRILDAAFELFAERGYDGVGVDLIGETVGMKGPSLYRHFKGKEDILHALIVKLTAYYDMNFGSEQDPGRIPDSMEELVALSLERICFTMHDPTIQKTRRLFAMEQFRNAEIAEETSKHHVYGLEGMYRKIFQGMIDKGILRNEDPALLAMEFVAPITLMIHMYDRQPEREAEAMERIERHTRHFAKEYGV